MDQGFWEERKWEDSSKKDIELCNRFKEGLHTKKRENISLIQRRERVSKGVYLEADKRMLYLTIKVTTDWTGVFCRKEDVMTLAQNSGCT